MSTEVKDMRFLDKVSLDQFYKNSRYNIEDPLFTGFTLNIDTLHSPLFYALAGDEYIASETLRSPEGTDTTLADKIEKKLSYMYKYAVMGAPDTYEINTIPAKDIFGPINERRPGYGNWNKVYLDNLLYGAADYIYMVDKIADGTYSDEEGVSDIGNGTPTTSVYEDYNKQLEDLDPNTDASAEAIQQQVDNNTSTTHNLNIFFNCSKWDIRPDQKPVADELLNLMTSNPDCTVNLKGYASLDDHANEPDYQAMNKTLSQNRINTVKNYLKGVDESRITTSFYGDTEQPFADNIKNRVVTCEIKGTFSQESSLSLKIVQEQASLQPVESTNPKDNNPIIKEHEDNQTELNTAQTNYDAKAGENSKYQTSSKELDDLNKAINDQIVLVKMELTKYVEGMNKYLALLKGNSESDEAKKNIENIYTKFEKYINYFEKPTSPVNSENEDEGGEKFQYSVRYSHIYLDISVVRKDDTNRFEKELKEIEGKEYDLKNKDYYQMAWAVIKTQINGVGVKKETKEERERLQNEVEGLAREIYGVHKDGRLGTKNDPAEGSLCYILQQAQDKFDNDAFSQQQYRVDELKDLAANYDDVLEYKKYNQDKKPVTRTMDSVDYAKRENESNDAYATRIDNDINSRTTRYEVPQTVYDMMGFIRGMYNLTHYYPYVLQTVTGLDEAYKKYFNTKDPYLGSGEDKITINCLEFLDLRVSSMFNKYFNAVYDRQYRRERVPMNLRRFQCSIFVHDIRNFRDALNSEAIMAGNDLSLITQIALNYVSGIEFKFFDCEIVPEETGSVFDNVVNNQQGDMRMTNFTFKYGNCIVNFLPFADLKKYILNKNEDKDVKPKADPSRRYDDPDFREDYLKLNDRPVINGQKVNFTEENKLYDGRYSKDNPSGSDLAGNFRRWYDRSELGNVNNNDYRDYIRHDSYVAVDDHYKTTIVNDFALGSLGQKNKELTAMDDALRKIVVGISASTGIPVKGVTDALNIKFIDPIINEKDMELLALKKIGNVNNSTILNEKTTEYLGEVITDKEKEQKVIKDLGNVEDNKE